MPPSTDSHGFESVLDGTPKMVECEVDQSPKRLKTLILLFILFSSTTLFAQGSWRWSVKVLADEDAESVDINKQVATTVDAQTRLKPYKPMKNGGVGQGDHDTPRHSSEDTVYSFDALIIGYKFEGGGDKDYHIVIKDLATDRTMVAEIPDPTLEPASNSSFVDNFTTAKESFASMLEARSLPIKPSKFYGDDAEEKIAIRVRIVGVGFWDIHGHIKNGDSLGHAKGSAFTGREIHPVLAIKDLDNQIAAAPSGGEPTPFVNANFTQPTPIGRSNMQTAPVMQTLAFFVLAMLLGMGGQLIRVIVGMKKLNDRNAAPGVQPNATFDSKQLIMSLAIAAIVGGVAGLVAALSTENVATIDKQTLLTLLGAGYAGTDFIEGFISKP